MAELSKRDREILANMVFIPPARRGKIDPKLIRKAVIAVRTRHLKAEAEAKAKAKAARKTKAEANGKAHEAADGELE